MRTEGFTRLPPLFRSKTESEAMTHRTSTITHSGACSGDNCPWCAARLEALEEAAKIACPEPITGLTTITQIQIAAAIRERMKT